MNEFKDTLPDELESKNLMSLKTLESGSEQDLRAEVLIRYPELKTFDKTPFIRKIFELFIEDNTSNIRSLLDYLVTLHLSNDEISECSDFDISSKIIECLHSKDILISTQGLKILAKGICCSESFNESIVQNYGIDAISDLISESWENPEVLHFGFEALIKLIENCDCTEDYIFEYNFHLELMKKLKIFTEVPEDVLEKALKYLVKVFQYWKYHEISLYKPFFSAFSKIINLEKTILQVYSIELITVIINNLNDFSILMIPKISAVLMKVMKNFDGDLCLCVLELLSRFSLCFSGDSFSFFMKLGIVDYCCITISMRNEVLFKTLTFLDNLFVCAFNPNSLESFKNLLWDHEISEKILKLCYSDEESSSYFPLKFTKSLLRMSNTKKISNEYEKVLSVIVLYMQKKNLSVVESSLECLDAIFKAIELNNIESYEELRKRFIRDHFDIIQRIKFRIAYQSIFTLSKTIIETYFLRELNESF